ncbi:hypothetical protein FS837_003513 [Tulasnella sp. UAMH 9824]|nr:hypothetical protein FS837_003513 [Tulasnella sp. UAMH 9824]
MDAYKIAQEAIESLSQLPAEVKFILEEIRLREEESAGTLQNLQKLNNAADILFSCVELQEAVDNCVELYAAGEVLLPFGVGSLEEWIQPDIDRIRQLSDENVELAKRLVGKLESKKGKLSFHVGRYIEATATSAQEPDPAPSTPRVAPSPSAPSTPRPTFSSLPPPSPSSRAAAVSSSSVKIKLSSPRRARRRSEVTRKKSPVSVPPLPRPRVYPAPSSPQPLALPDPSEIPPHPGPLRRGRGRTRIRSPPSQAVDTPEGEDATSAHSQIEGYEDEEDTTLYCFCRQMSHGEFHLECVGRSEPPPNEEKWYCSDDCAETSTSHPSSLAHPDPYALLKSIEQELLDLAVGFPHKELPIPEAGPSNKQPQEATSSTKRRSPRRNRKKKT